MEKIQKKSKTDKMAKILKEENEANPGTDKEAYWKELIYVPQKIRKEVIKECHNKSTAGHFRIERTIEKIARTYYFPHMRQEVEKYIHQCDKCNKAKPQRHKPYGKLQPLKTSRGA